MKYGEPLLWVITIPSKPGIIPYSNELTRVFLMAQLQYQQTDNKMVSAKKWSVGNVLTTEKMTTPGLFFTLW